MESFKHKKKEVVFSFLTGEIIDQTKFSETQVSSSGGGGYITPQGGVVNPTRIHSNQITNQEFWIRTDNGIEESVSLKGHDIPIRVGQKVTLIIAGLSGADKRYYSVLVNHTAGKYWFINNAKLLNERLNIETISKGLSCLAMIPLAIISFYLSYYLADSLGFIYLHMGSDYSSDSAPFWRYIAIFIIGPFILPFCFSQLIDRTKGRRIEKMLNKLDSHLTKLANLAESK